MSAIGVLVIWRWYSRLWDKIASPLRGQVEVSWTCIWLLLSWSDVLWVLDEKRQYAALLCLHVSHSFVDLCYPSIPTAISPVCNTKKSNKQLWKPVTLMLHCGKSKYSKTLSYFIHLQRRKALTSFFSLGLRHSRTSTGDLGHLRRGGIS